MHGVPMSSAREARGFEVLENPLDSPHFATFQASESDQLIFEIGTAIKLGRVALVQGVGPDAADRIIGKVADRFGILDSLEIQSGFAGIQGHRENIGRYLTTVNRRPDYGFLCSHSEGQRNMVVQIACFYCYENTTDGGVTILQSTDPNSSEWSLLREVTIKLDLCGRTLSRTDVAQARALFGVILPDDILSDRDEVLRERESPFSGVRFFDTLSPLTKAYSVVSEQHVYVCWENVSAADLDSTKQFMQLLRNCELLREPVGRDISKLDYSYSRKVFSSGMAYEKLFTSRVIRKLRPQEFIIFNNMLWTHAASNWTHSSGIRKLAAVFA